MKAARLRSVPVEVLVLSRLGRVGVPKVLIVEDHPDMRELFGRLFELMGFVPLSAANARDGLKEAVAERPDLIVIDIMMPGMDGWQLTRALRASRETREIPILAATAMAGEADLRTCLEAGCNDYIIKPFAFADLRKKVAAMVP